MADLADPLDRYLVKAFREAKRHTAWIDPDEEWERAVVGRGRTGDDRSRFLECSSRSSSTWSHRADRISLGALVLRTTAPGVPDIYQGDELWNLLLVDPDNRRPVDWSLRELLLETSCAAQVGGSVHGQALHLAVRRWPDAARSPGIRRARVCAARCTRRCVRVVCRSPDVPDVVVVVPVRPDRTLELPSAVEDLGAVDLLEPLGAVYGAHRPGVFVTSDIAAELRP